MDGPAPLSVFAPPAGPPLDRREDLGIGDAERWSENGGWAGEDPAGEDPAGEEWAGEEWAGEEWAGEEWAGEPEEEGFGPVDDPRPAFAPDLEDLDDERVDQQDLDQQAVDTEEPETGYEEERFEAEEFARHAVFAATGPDAAEARVDEVIPEVVDEVTPVPAGTPPPVRTTAQLRTAWRADECATVRMVPVRLFGWRTPVNPATVDAWRGLEAALVGAGYRAHRAWAYVCRDIAGQRSRSLHAYGLALDVDHSSPTCQVNRATPDRRPVRFSDAATHDARCADVRRGVADTAFTPAHVAAVEAIRTVDGHQVFAWGGRWRTTKDTMHFQINVTPAELARGIAGGAPAGAPAVVAPLLASDYAAVTRKILGRKNPKVGVVLSVVQLTPSGPMVDTRSEPGRFRRRLVNPPPHVVLPAEIHEITHRRTRLRYVWIMSHPKAAFAVGGVLFLPPDGGTVCWLVTVNVGALEVGCTNVHHAEMQAVHWIGAQPTRALLSGVAIWNLSRRAGLGYSPCTACCVDLARLPATVGAVRRAAISWLTLYDGNAACGHPTDARNLRAMVAAGWTLQGPLPPGTLP